MKRYLTALLFAGIVASSAHADITRVEMGAGVWAPTPKGDISYTNGASSGKDVLNEKDKNYNYVWLLIKHPVPVLPNLKLEYANVENTGLASGTFEDFIAAPNTPTALKMQQFDIIPYYNIFDNTSWLTVDLGLDIKIINLDYTANNVTINGTPNQNYNDTTTLAIPMLYLRTRVEIPSTNIGLEGDVKYITYDGSTISDMRAKIDYTFDFIPVVKPTLELGYRVQKIDISNSSVKSAINIEYSGMFLGLMLRF